MLSFKKEMPPGAVASEAGLFAASDIGRQPLGIAGNISSDSLGVGVAPCSVRSNTLLPTRGDSGFCLFHNDGADVPQ